MANTTLLKLPDELLIKIAHQFDVSDLLAFSVTCCRLSNVAQEVLVGTSTFSVKNALKLIETLQSKPGLCQALTEVRLGALNCERIGDLCPRMKLSTWEDAYDVLYASYLRSETPPDMNIILPTEARLSAHVARLFALATGPKALSMGTSSVEVVPLLSFCLDGAVRKHPRRMLGWFEQVRNDLQEHLELLEVVPEQILPKYNPILEAHVWPSTYISLTHFDRLKRLTVPLRMISQRPAVPYGSGESRFKPTNPLKVLPRSLQFVRLITDGLMIFPSSRTPEIAWIDKLIAPNSGLMKLHHVELQFEFNILSTAPMFRRVFGEGKVATAFLTALEAWKKGSIVVTTTFKDNMPLGETLESYQPTYQYLPGDLITALKNGS